MLVFIDESGDPGFKLERNSSPVFVVAMIVFHDHAEAAVVDREIEGIRTPTRQKTEFKFSKCRDNVRDVFCQTVAAFDFVIRAIVVDKQYVYSDALRENKELFYNYFVRMMMQHDGDLLRDAIVKIDESGDRRFKREMQTYLRRHLREKIKKVRMVDSKNNNLVQLADMVAGAIHRSFRDDRRNATRWRDQLQHRIEDVWTFPNRRNEESSVGRSFQ